MPLALLYISLIRESPYDAHLRGYYRSDFRVILVKDDCVVFIGVWYMFQSYFPIQQDKLQFRYVFKELYNYVSD